MIAGGVDIIQLRAKDRSASEISTIARELHRLTSSARRPADDQRSRRNRARRGSRRRPRRARMICRLRRSARSLVVTASSADQPTASRRRSRPHPRALITLASVRSSRRRPSPTTRPLACKIFPPFTQRSRCRSSASAESNWTILRASSPPARAASSSSQACCKPPISQSMRAPRKRHTHSARLQDRYLVGKSVRALAAVGGGESKHTCAAKPPKGMASAFTHRDRMWPGQWA